MSSVVPPIQVLFGRLQTMQARLQLSTEQVEDSVTLRVLVQILVSVGIASVAIAALGIVEVSFLNLVAILISAAGGYWSWKSRHHSNVAVKFVLAFGMLMALGLFLSRIVGGGDTRIRLAELLIQLQVLHSFDMPRRKDLGYSIVIGLILLGVAATVSQTLTLGPVLVLFLAIALPVLMLDYRSRLGLVRLPGKGMLATFNLKRLAWLLLLIGGLGLLIFATLPRLPGYQVRNFPVSSPINVQGQFSGNQIVNPGYAGNLLDSENTEGLGDSTLIQGDSPEDGPGEMSGNFYYGFSQRMNQNLRGKITPQVVMRVRSQAPGFLRVLAFDRYTGQGWEISRQAENQIEVLDRSSYSYKTILPPAAFKTHSQNSDARYQEVIQTYTITNTLPNLIPALYQARRLYFPTQEVAIDAEGSLRSPLPLADGLTFTVISNVPYRDRTPLRQASTEYEDDTTENYLQVPEAIKASVQEQTEALLARSPEPLTDPYEKALFLAQALKQNYTLQEELPFFDADEDLVEAFLFRYEGGYPDHFSTVMTVMLRSIGIPARLVTGFSPGRFNAFTGYYVVNNTDAHAMTEVYFPNYGWFAFNPIPGREIVPPSIRDSQTFSVLQQFWNWVAGWLPTPVSGWLSGVFAGLLQILSRLLKFFSGSVVGILSGLMTATGLAFLGWLSWQGWRSWRRRSRLRGLPPVERIYQQMLIWLAGKGYPKHPTQTPLEYATALKQTNQFTQAAQVMTVVQAYMRWRYGDRSEDVETLQYHVRSMQKGRSR